MRKHDFTMKSNLLKIISVLSGADFIEDIRGYERREYGNFRHETTLVRFKKRT